MSATQTTAAWAKGYFSRSAGDVEGTYTALYRIKDLIAKGYISARDGQAFLIEAGLQDFLWEVTWAEDYETADEELDDRLRDVQGYAVFIHGWTGNHRIFEHLPGMVVRANRRLVSISVDHNGFGQSRFTSNTPTLESCNPPAAMKTIQKWIDLIGLRRQLGDPNPKVINFVGHSMGGATLFYLDPLKWRFGEETRYALAPALLKGDEVRKTFYTTLGIGIGILQKVPVLEIVERFVKPGILQALLDGGSEDVTRLHADQYETTPRGITGATFMAMGLLNNYEIPYTWDCFRVMLGHRDRLVGLVEMLDLLGEHDFPASNIRVVSGSHYMFSVGRDPHTAYRHAQARQLVVEDILMLHNKAYEMQRTGKKIG